VNQEAADVQDEEPAEPEQNQHNSQNKKHERPSFLERFAALGANRTSHRSGDAGDSLLGSERLAREAMFKFSDPGGYPAFKFSDPGGPPHCPAVNMLQSMIYAMSMPAKMS
jgi:hypothetical protein